MKLAYFILLASFGILTAIASAPDVAMIFALYTLGLGALLLIAGVNVFLALLCLLPVALSPAPRKTPWVLSALLAALVFVGPSFYSAFKANSMEQAAVAQDLQSSDVFASGDDLGLELVRPVRVNVNLWKRILTDDLCGTLCRRALHGGQIDWIRIVAKANRASEVDSVAVVRRGNSPDCAETLCYLYADDPGTPADITLQFDEDYTGPYDANTNPKGFAQMQGLRRLTVLNGSDVVWRQSEVHLFTIPRPAYLRPAFHGLTNGGNKGGLHFPRQRDVRNGIDPEAIAATLGLRLADVPSNDALQRPQKSSPQGDRDKVVSLLDQAGPIDQAFENEIYAWMRTLHRLDTPSDTDIELVMRIIKDPRLKKPRDVADLFERKAALQKVLLPWFFAELNNRSTHNTDFMEMLAARMAWADLGQDGLHPYAEQFRTFLTNWPSNHMLLNATGRFGFDPEPILRRIYEFSPQLSDQVMSAVCYSDPVWRASLEPLVREILADDIRIHRHKRIRGSTEKALKFLVYTGHRDDAVAIIQANDWRNGTQVIRSGFAKPDAKGPPKGRFCH